tara:strand:+ start:134 stop:475 length:342 start_codon:yes stop_codon:yes gene_type:complete
MERFKNFKNFENDKGLSLNSSPIYKKNYSIDLGSKLGNDKFYQRSILLKRTYGKNMLNLNFFSEENNSSKYFKASMLKMHLFLQDLSNINNVDYTADKLKDLIFKFFKKNLDK